MNPIHVLTTEIPPPFDRFGLENPWLVVVVILVLSYVGARVIEWGGKKLLQRTDSWAENSFNRTFFEVIHAPLYLSVGLVGVYASLFVLDIVDSGVYLVSTVQTTFLLLWAWAALRLGSRWIEYVHSSDNHYKFAPVFKNLWKIATVIGTGLLLISIWNLEITPFLASAGILGIIIGLAAQESVSNLIGGISLYFDNTYKVGDVILLDDNGLRGTVVDIGIRSTTVLTRDNVTVTVPNSILNSSQVINQSTPQRRTRMRIPITAAYGTDYRKVEEILLSACEESSLVTESPQPQVLFSEFGDSALVFELRAFVVHPLSEKRAINQINRTVYDEFAKAEITIPFPQREISYLDDLETDENAPVSDPAPEAEQRMEMDTEGPRYQSYEDGT